MTPQPHPDPNALAGLRSVAAAATDDDRLVLLCLIAGRDLRVDEVEFAAALRRSELLLAAGGDPRRPLDLNGRAVTALADDLDDPERRAQLMAALVALRPASTDLPVVAATLERLTCDAGLAWQCYAMARLAEHLADDE